MMTSLAGVTKSLLALSFVLAVAGKTIAGRTMRVLSEQNPGWRPEVERRARHGQGKYVLSFGDTRAAFESWKLQYGRVMTSSDDVTEAYRKFQKNLAYIETHNLRYAMGDTSFYMGLNQFAAMNTSEYHRYNRLASHSFTSRRGLSRKSLTRQDGCVEHSDPDSLIAAEDPSFVDWTARGYVTAVKNQGDCGSCWIFSATGAMEGAYFRRHKRLVSLSEQEILDCCQLESCDGCEGGLPSAAYLMVRGRGGEETERAYPYKAWSGWCHMKKAKFVARVNECFTVTPEGSEDALKHACATHGPISVAIDASLSSFQFYDGGVYYDPRCGSGPEDLDHAVLVTGYGQFDRTQEQYWAVKNSWGTDWGQDGYVLMARGRDNACGIASEATYVTML